MKPLIVFTVITILTILHYTKSEEDTNFDFVFPDNPILKTTKSSENVPEALKPKCECVVYFECDNTKEKTEDPQPNLGQQCEGYPYFTCCNNIKQTEILEPISLKSKLRKKDPSKSKFQWEYEPKVRVTFTGSTVVSSRPKRSPQNIQNWVARQASSIFNKVSQGLQNQGIANVGWNLSPQNPYIIPGQISIGGNFMNPAYPSDFQQNLGTGFVNYNPQFQMAESYPVIQNPLFQNQPGYSMVNQVPYIPDNNYPVLDNNYPIPNNNPVDYSSSADSGSPDSYPDYVENTSQSAVSSTTYIPQTSITHKPTTPPIPVTPKPTSPPTTQKPNIDAVFADPSSKKPAPGAIDQSLLDEIFNIKNESKPVIMDSKIGKPLKDADGDECECIYYYLCDEKTGEIVTDGSGVLDVRFEAESNNLCPGNKEHMCCKLTNIKKS